MHVDTVDVWYLLGNDPNDTIYNNIEKYLSCNVDISLVIISLGSIINFSSYLISYGSGIDGSTDLTSETINIYLR